MRRLIKKISPVWIITLLSFMGAGHLTWQWMVKRGPQITISFTDATGLVPTQTGIFYRGAEVGKVTAISLKDKGDLLVTARMQKTIEPLLKEGTVFWIARPEVDLQGIRNLSTIASGSIIEMKAGEGKFTLHFTGKEKAPLSDALAKGKEIIIKAHKLGSITTGTPITFRDIKTGEVIATEVSDDSQWAIITASIYPDYAKLVKEDSTFWDDGEVSASFSLMGESSLNIPSLASLVSGKIAFASNPDSAMADAGSVFTLQPAPKTDRTSGNGGKQVVSGLRILLEAQNLGSIMVGTPVTFRDVKAGEVTHIDVTKNGNSVMITVRIYPKYAQHVQSSTLFWDDGKVNADIQLFGDSKVNVPSVGTLISGKIAFITPAEGAKAKAGQIFPLHPSPPKKKEEWQGGLPWQSDN